MSEAERIKEIIDGLEHALKSERHRYEYGKEPMLQTDTIIPIINARNYLSELQTTALRAQEQNEPLTCEGCDNYKNKYGSNGMNAPCKFCVRGIMTYDYYKSAHEPKGADQ